MSILEPMASLRGRTAMITGAAGAIGRVLSEQLAELGADLLLVDRQDSELAAVGKAIEERWSVGVTTYTCDLEEQTQRQTLIEQANSRTSGLHVLVNNAAFVGTSDLQGWSTEFRQQSTETWRRAMEVNLTAVFELCRGFADSLSEHGKGSIVNIASIYGLLGPDYSLYGDSGMGNPAAYAASKGGLVQLTRWLATTLAPSVRVNSISPGGVFREQDKEFVKRYEARTPLGRMATEDDLRGALAFFASDMSGYCTGQNLAVDGGWSCW